jgi:hypothetical protein
LIAAAGGEKSDDNVAREGYTSAENPRSFEGRIPAGPQWPIGRIVAVGAAREHGR